MYPISENLWPQDKHDLTHNAGKLFEFALNTTVFKKSSEANEAAALEVIALICMIIMGY
jgi:hypothetical protein